MHSSDSDWQDGIMTPENTACSFSLVGIVGIYELAEAGRTKDVLECLRNGESVNGELVRKVRRN
jgi:hypothetical protein